MHLGHHWSHPLPCGAREASCSCRKTQHSNTQPGEEKKKKDFFLEKFLD